MTIRALFFRSLPFAATAMLSASGWCAPPLTVAWRDKPPYHYTEQGEAKGFLLERVKNIFSVAGVPVQFVNEPQKRIWANFTHGATNYCSISWYRLPEREAVAQYTSPIHEDLPHTVLISQAAVQRVKAHPTLSSLLDDPSLTLGVVEGVSYGPALDQMIKDSKNQIMSRTVETTLMMRMLTVGRASFMFVDREDWEYFRAREKTLHVAVRHDFPDMPPGMKRHILCSKDVPAETMAKLNQAIAATGGINNPGHSAKPK
ncbi:substrate-binding periplasmic protein [Rugamonas aquatica]|uniref:Transporter substrate-binding domain-containing protein n=1 Tax=Rugamonas aquatica TaxID=2743357 RepID=A0A6A7N2G9_9BURK|nr:transporter substrate-binding domain-containing protein [Rugamonas aquatica]MQA39120.1 transporter substrate-binding domain-containing protein [Rugamonas aquatica]